MLLLVAVLLLGALLAFPVWWLCSACGEAVARLRVDSCVVTEGSEYDAEPH